jgi:hypothetical protein
VNAWNRIKDFAMLLTHPQKVLYSATSIQKRAMTHYFGQFAFTYRFSLAGERAGETRADKT